jgi:hypothetical protein
MWSFHKPNEYKYDDINSGFVALIRKICLQLTTFRGHESAMTYRSLAFTGFVRAVLGLPMSCRGQLLA